MTGAYYNEIDPYCVKWLRNLIKAGLIADGVVDDRDIRDVQPRDLEGYRQAHFFAGIGGWGYALRLAGWPDDCDVWTGSCPCQPLSSIGNRKGHADPRHLWPAFHRLIARRKPPTIFGEQVTGPLGREWLAAVRLDLEALRYSFGATDLPAVSVGAPHIRSRLYFVANANPARRQNAERLAASEGEQEGWPAAGVVCGPKHRHLFGSAVPDASWVIDGLPPAMDQLCALGNAIVPQVAAAFIEAARHAIGDTMRATT